jgi:hypothetical protein
MLFLKEFPMRYGEGTMTIVRRIPEIMGSGLRKKND